eukprot:Em0032g34a
MGSLLWQHDFRLNLDRHVIVHTFDPEFIVIEKLVESMSLALGTLTFTPCNGWKVDKLCYKRQSTFILEDTFMVTISDVKECSVDWENYSQRNEGDHQLTVNLENSQDNHWELELSSIRWVCSFANDIGQTPEEALSLYMEHPSLDPTLKTKMPDPSDSETFISQQDLHSILEKVDWLSEHRYLQSVNTDYEKALALIDSVIASQEGMRSAPQDIIRIMERSVQDSSNIQWRTTRVSRRMCRITEDGEVPETPEESWQRKTFFVALDTILASMRRRFDKNGSLFETLVIFVPSKFIDLVKSGITAQDLHCTMAEFCDNLNTSQCIQEMLSFAAVYHRFHTPSSTCPKMDVVDNTDSLSDDTGDDGIGEEDEEV